MNSFLLGLCVAVCVSVAAAADKFYYKTPPKWVKQCFYSDPKLDECLRRDFQMMIDTWFREGFPELKLLKADPLQIEKLEIISGNPTDAVNLNIEANTLLIQGLGATQVLENSFNRDTMTWYEKMYVSEASLTGDYKARGKVLIVPINGHGKCDFQLRNMTVELISHVNLIEKDGHLFNNITNFKVKYNLQQLNFQLENLFEGNPALSRNISNYLSDNWRAIAPAFEPVLEELFQGIFDLFVNKIISAVPMEFWLGDIQQYVTPKKN